MEPIYTYEKGKGWVLTTQCNFEIFEYDGRTWKIEERKPITGEYYMWITDRFNTEWCENGKPVFQKFIESFKRYGTYRYAGLFFDIENVVCTVTQV